MRTDFRNYRTDVFVSKNSEIMLTIGTKLSLNEAKIVCDVKNWKKF